MFAGTSTGSILATALSLKSETNKTQPMFWAKDANEIYINSAEDLFKKNGVSRAFEIICYSSFISVFAIMFYLIGVNKYRNKKVILAQ